MAEIALPANQVVLSWTSLLYHFTALTRPDSWALGMHAVCRPVLVLSQRVTTSSQSCWEEKQVKDPLPDQPSKLYKSCMHCTRTAAACRTHPQPQPQPGNHHPAACCVDAQSEKSDVLNPGAGWECREDMPVTPQLEGLLLSEAVR